MMRRFLPSLALAVPTLARLLTAGIVLAAVVGEVQATPAAALPSHARQVTQLLLPAQYLPPPPGYYPPPPGYYPPPPPGYGYPVRPPRPGYRPRPPIYRPAPPPVYLPAPPALGRPMPVAHVRWCMDRYRSYRPQDNTYQPYNGPRRQCRSPYW